MKRIFYIGVIIVVFLVCYVLCHNSKYVSVKVLNEHTVVLNGNKQYDYDNSLEFLQKVLCYNDNASYVVFSAVTNDMPISNVRRFIEKTQLLFEYIDTGENKIPVKYYSISESRNIQKNDCNVVNLRVGINNYQLDSKSFKHDELFNIKFDTLCILQIICNYDSMYSDLIRLLNYIVDNPNIKEIYIIMNG